MNPEHHNAEACAERDLVMVGHVYFTTALRSSQVHDGDATLEGVHLLPTSSLALFFEE